MLTAEDTQKLEKAFRPQYEAACDEIMPARYRQVNPKTLQPSKLSRLPLEEQAKLYKEINERPLEGWAFFAPAGYSKTTVSWALFKHALRENLLRAIITGQSENIKRGGMDRPRLLTWTPCYCWHVVVPDWLKQIQQSWNENVAPPVVSSDKMAKARRDGFVPRLFLEEIDKCKEGSEWATNEFFLLLRALDEEKGQLVLDTNLTRQQFLNRFGETAYRRVKQLCNMREYGF
jgi:hypothetical protein